ncbi:hypothetical protein JCM3770_002124 [Rhodotorula araucariae]
MPRHTLDKHKDPRKPYAKPRPPASSSAPPRLRRPFPRPDDADGRESPKGRYQKPAPTPKTKSQPTQLDLSGQQLAAPPPAADLANIAKLNLSNCGLTSIAFAKSAASSLTWLNVTGNSLAASEAWRGIEQLQTLFVLNASHCGLTEVPACVASLSKLKALVLSHNSLTSLKHVANLPDLNTIVVSNNALTALPSTLATLPSLKKISAAHNRLTSSSLPDLSALSHLHELRLNDNPTLTSLPSHFGAWGKADGAKGLEILDLGNCGFESWFGLRELAKQGGVVNLGLKGNKVAEDAVREAGFDEFKAKLTILLPALRILDTHRFDAKFADLKSRRAQRTEEQKILDAGPMALAANAARAAPVAVDEVLRARERERENKRRRRKGIAEEVGEGRAKKRVRAEDDAGESGDAAEAPRAHGDAEESAAAVAATEEKAAQEKIEEERRKPKKRKSRAEKRAAKEGADATAAVETDTGAPPVVDPTAPGPAAVPEVPDATTPLAAAKKDKVKSKGKKRKGGVLAALQGDDDDDTAAPRAPKPTPAPAPAAEAAPALAPKEEKQKTSVAKIIEVRRPGAADAKGGKRGKKGAAAADAEAAPKVDVGALLGLTKPAGAAAEEGKEDGARAAIGAGLGESAWSAGSGLFGWD